MRASARQNAPRPGAKHTPSRGFSLRRIGLSRQWPFFPLPLWERVDRMSVSSFETGEGSVSADGYPSSAFAVAKAPSPTRGEGKTSFLGLVDRQHLQRRRVGFDAQRVGGENSDLVQRRLFEVA